MSADAYADYLHRFFARWSPLYDAFALPVAHAYAAAARTAAAAPGRRILDLCTGTGELALRAARRGAEVVAVDFTPSMLERAARKTAGLGVLCVEMDARRLAFPPASFDVVVLSFALHDMPRGVRREVLREATRVAREAIVVLDYEVGIGVRGRLLARGLESFETAYLRGFLRDGGIAGALGDGGLVAERRSRPLPGLAAVWRAPLARTR
jgi:ubiquinone/menaquinone biosynthesis C-methylase UbiE